MDSIVIKHIIDESEIIINFDFSNGSLPFPSIKLKTDGDIDLNSLVIKLIELIEEKRTVKWEYEDANSLLETNPKVQLIKGTLDDIYSVFNKSFNDSEIDEAQNHVEQNPDDLPF
jgi:hypothetical protein